MQRKKNKQNISKILRSILFSYFCLSPRGSLQVQHVVVTHNFIYNFKSKSLIIYLLLFLFFLPRCSLQEGDISCRFHPEGCGFKSPTSLFQHTMSMFGNVSGWISGAKQRILDWIGILVLVTQGDPSRLRLYSASFRQMFACPARSRGIHTRRLFWWSLNTFLARAMSVRCFGMWNGCGGR